MAKRAEIFLRVPQGPPGAPLAENKLLWRRRATVAGEMRGQKKNCLEVEIFKEFVFLQTQIHKHSQRKQGGKGGGSGKDGWVGGGWGWLGLHTLHLHPHFWWWVLTLA